MKLYLKVLLALTFALGISSSSAGNLIDSYRFGTTTTSVSLLNTASSVTGESEVFADITNAAIGGEAADRFVLVVVGWSEAVTITSVNIGGSAATLLDSHISGTVHVSVYYLLVTTGTTATVNTNWSAELGDDVGIGVFRLTGTGGSITLDSYAETIAFTDAISLNTVTIPSNGAALFAVAANGDDSTLWTNATESYDLDLGTDGRASSAITSTAGTPTVTATIPASTKVLLGMAWGP